MDAKALAKSKRAHSQQHSKKPHPSPKPKPSSDNRTDASNSKKPLGKQLREKDRQAQRLAALPSNSDRYEEQRLDSDSVSAPQLVPDDVLPKSKGADYSYLISEARSHAMSNPYPDDFPSLADVMPGDFNQFVGSMMSVRGESILAWTADDNFVVEDRVKETPEAAFLSLNLRALAEQLEKIDICRRLFIEEDLFPPEMHGRSSNAKLQESEQIQKCSESEEASQTREGILLSEFSEKFHILDKNLEGSSLHSGSKHQELASPNADLNLKDQYEDDIHSVRQDSIIMEDVNSSEMGRKVSKFETRVAEAELDMLLDSLNENKSPGSTDIKYGIAASNFQRDSTATQLQLPGNVTDLPRTAPMAVSFDDELDNLLVETSSNEFGGKSPSVIEHHAVGKGASILNTSAGAALGERPQPSHPDDATLVNSSSSSDHVNKSKVLDDFDSWSSVLSFSYWSHLSILAGLTRDSVRVQFQFQGGT